MSSSIRNDPYWATVSASKVGRKLFVKMPPTFVPSILMDLELCLLRYPDEELRTDLLPWAQGLEKAMVRSVRRGEKAIILPVPTKEVEEELALLGRLTEPTGQLRQYMMALRGGLEGQPHLDWIARVRGSGLSSPVAEPTSLSEEEGWDFFESLKS